MALMHEDSIEDFQAHMRKLGGAASEWLIGTAPDAPGPFFQKHLRDDLDDEMIYREAFTTTAAEAIRGHFVNDCGLELDREDSPAPGKMVFIYRRGGSKRGEVNSPLWVAEGVVIGGWRVKLAGMGGRGSASPAVRSVPSDDSVPTRDRRAV
jgi:hypothetical protein